MFLVVKSVTLKRHILKLCHTARVPQLSPLLLLGHAKNTTSLVDT